MEHHNQRIEGMQCEDGVIEDAEYSECALRKCVFSNTALHNVKFINCVFEDCSLRNVTFRASSMLSAVFQDCSLMGLDWSTVRRHGARLSLMTKMRSCSVKYNTFIDMNMAKMDFHGSVLHDCYFQECVLKQADFRDCDLRNTIFLNCDLGKADFREARNYGINVMTNKVAKAKFSQPDVVGLLSGFDIIIE